MSRYESELSESQWERVQGYVQKKTGRPPRVDRREVVNAIFYLLRTGCQWRSLPREFPHYSTVHSCYRRWRLDGTLEKLHEALRQEVRVQAGREAHPTACVLDSQSMKTTEKGGPEATTRPRT